MKRGDLVTIAVAGDYGKPRPALIVQSDLFAELPSVTVLRLTSEVHSEDVLRVTLQSSLQNGLRKPSQVMIDKAVTVPRRKAGSVIGSLDSATMSQVSRALATFLGIE